MLLHSAVALKALTLGFTLLGILEDSNFSRTQGPGLPLGMSRKALHPFSSKISFKNILTDESNTKYHTTNKPLTCFKAIDVAVSMQARKTKANKNSAQTEITAGNKLCFKLVNSEVRKSKFLCQKLSLFKHSYSSKTDIYDTPFLAICCTNFE